jgi:hypothetical protein
LDESITSIADVENYNSVFSSQRERIISVEAPGVVTIGKLTFSDYIYLQTIDFPLATTIED